MKVNLPEIGRKRIVIIGAGFAGLQLTRQLQKLDVQIVLVDQNNYHQFQPLLYQVAMSGLEPSSVVFPLRRMFQHKHNVFIRITTVEKVDTEAKRLYTPLGHINYDMLVIATGATTKFFGNKELEEKVIPMKSVSEALFLRNSILKDLEKAISVEDHDERQGLIDIVVVGGGPTGVEIAGAIAEMKRFILPKEYREIDTREVSIYLIQSNVRLLPHMRQSSSEKARKYLEDLEVNVECGVGVKDYDGKLVSLEDGRKIRADKVIWAAGVSGCIVPGLPDSSAAGGGRVLVDPYHAVKDCKEIYAIGDVASMVSEDYEWGHPQVAPAAVQQAKNLANNIKADLKGKKRTAFVYKDKGSMATIGRNKAVVDLRRNSFTGFFAWVVWLIVHLFSLIGVRNKIIVFLNWLWNYITYDQYLRLIIEPKGKEHEHSD